MCTEGPQFINIFLIVRFCVYLYARKSINSVYLLARSRKIYSKFITMVTSEKECVDVEIEALCEGGLFVFVPFASE